MIVLCWVPLLRAVVTVAASQIIVSSQAAACVEV